MNAPSQTNRASSDPKVEANKRTVLSFYDAAINKRDFDAASKFIGKRYVQHNPLIADGIEGFRAFIDLISREFPDLRADIKRVLADGDFVIVHAHGVRVPGDLGTAIIDIFRLDDGKIVEHWDVMQPVPDKAANRNGMV